MSAVELRRWLGRTEFRAVAAETPNIFWPTTVYAGIPSTGTTHPKPMAEAGGEVVWWIDGGGRAGLGFQVVVSQGPAGRMRLQNVDVTRRATRGF